MSGSSTGSVTQYDTIAPINGDGTQTVVIAPFDPSLGVLYAVGISITPDLTGSVSVENLSANAGTVDVTQTGVIDLFGSDGGQVGFGSGSLTVQAVLSAFDGTDDYAGTSGKILTVNNWAGTTTTSANMSDFLGTAPITLTAVGSTSVSESGPGSLQVLSLASVGATVGVTYYYDDYGSITSTIIYSYKPGQYYDPPEIASGSTTTAPQTFVIPDSASGWTKALSVAQFNPALGTLEAVNISLVGDADSSFQFENLSPAAGTVVASDDTTFTITVAGSGSGTSVSMPSASASVALGAYDGTQDFAGSSGTIVPGQAITATGTLQLGDDYNLALFTGTSTTELDIAANGTSDLTGPGDLLSQLLDAAGATVTVTYTYLPSPTPEVVMSDAGGSDPTFTWTGATNTNLGTASNWDNITNSQTPATTTPLSTDTALFGANGGVLTGTETIGVVQFGSSGLWSLGSGASLTAASSLTVSSGAVVVSAGASLISHGSTDMVSGTSGLEGEIEVTGTGALFSGLGALMVGGSGLGQLMVQQGGSVNTAGAATIANTASASGSSASVTGTNAAWTIGGTLAIGVSGSGSLNIAAGGTVTAGSLITASTTAGSAVLSVSGTLSALNATGDLIIGGSGNADLDVTGGATIGAGTLDIGLLAGSSGVVDVEGASALFVTGTLNIGDAGNAVLSTGADVLVAAGAINIGTAGVFIQFGDPTLTGVFTNSNSLQVASGTNYITATVEFVNDGPIIIEMGALETITTPLLIGTGSIEINPTGELILNAGSVVGTQSIVFEGTSGGGTLQIGAGDIGQFGATVTAFQAGDEIILAGTSVASVGFVGNVATLFGSGGGQIGTLAFAGGAVSGGYLTASNGVLTEVACFAEGTRLATVRGEVAVEALREGDLVRTVLGGNEAAITWIGRRTVDCARHPQPRQVWPVRVRAGAFGAETPRRDLYLSPDHAVYVNEVLVPVRHLVNGTSIAQVMVDSVTYYHVELPAHDVVLAEGLAAESYLETGNRANFSNGGGVVRQFPDFAAQAWEALGCAPLIVSGPELAAARARVGLEVGARAAA